MRTTIGGPGGSLTIAGEDARATMTLDRLLVGLRNLPIPGEDARRAERVEVSRARLAKVLDWLLALPASADTTKVIDLMAQWLSTEPNDPSRPSDRLLAALDDVRKSAMKHLNRTAAGVAYAALPAGIDARPVFAGLERAARGVCGSLLGRSDDVAGRRADDRPGLRWVEWLINSGHAQVLITPSMSHLVPVAPHEAVGPWSAEGIRDWLAGHGVRLVLTERESPPGRAASPYRRP
ncbi:hypothetical protein [Streptomyces sp. NPDC048606]|uniref:hypothetical protein n=1 Tax=Streptomyces sp. NPDC048606 TaxID=3154726 RepID=UPI00342CF650